jgi:hypothetical protein
VSSTGPDIAEGGLRFLTAAEAALLGAALVAGRSTNDPARPPAAGRRPADMRYHWVEVWLDRLDDQEMRELVTEAWRMVVPKGVAAAHLERGS